MSEKINVSVLIPVYGVERYIERCARSLFEQTMKTGIEFIFTDDCTPDNSIEIVKSLLEEYPERKDQVKFLRHETNQGLAVARVTGLQAASGEYVIHCDSDDWVEPDMYELLYAKAHETHADIVGCDFFDELPKKTIIKKQDFSLPKSEIIEEILHDGKVNGYLWNRLIRRKFYADGDYRAPKEITLYEDMYITVPMQLDARLTSFVDKPLYHYRRDNGNSMTQVLSHKNLVSGLNALKHIVDVLSENEKLQNSAKKKFTDYACRYILDENFFSPKDWKRIYRSDRKYLLPSKKIKVVILIISLNLPDKISWKLIKVISSAYNRTKSN